MKIAIFGAGAVGGHLAAKLGAAGAAVSAIARGAHLAAIQDRGITLAIGEERYHARITATDRPETLGPQDVVIVTLKATSLGALAGSIAPLLGPETAVIFALNGIPWWYLHGIQAAAGAAVPDLSRLDPGGALATGVAPERVIGCVIASANTVEAPGLIRNSPQTRNRFTLGEPDGAMTPRLEAIARTLEAAGIATPLTRNIRRDIWDKLIRNLTTSPICALTGEPIGVLGRHPELLAIAEAVMAEAVAVAAAQGHAIELSVAASYGARPSSPHKSSMLQDFEQGRPPEIDAILTATQAFARASGVSTPHLDTLTALVVEKGRQLGLYPA